MEIKTTWNGRNFIQDINYSKDLIQVDEIYI